ADAIGDGTHTIDVQAMSASGQWGSSASFVIWVDAPLPTSVLSDPPPDADSDGDGFAPKSWYDDDGDVTLTWSGASDTGGSGFDRFYASYEGGSWIDVGSSTSNTFTSVPDGTRYLYLRVYDIAGNYTQYNTSQRIVFDRSDPAGSIAIDNDTADIAGNTNPENGFFDDTTVGFSWSSIVDSTAGVSGNMFQYKIDNGSWSPWSTNTSTSNVSMAEGSHTVYVGSVDNAGNYKVFSNNIVVDLTTPSLTVAMYSDADSASSGDGIAPDYHYFDDNYVDFYWSLDDGVGAGAYSGGAYRYRLAASDAGGNTQWSGWTSGSSVSNLQAYSSSDNYHNLVYVQARDRAGHTVTANTYFYVDLNNPSGTILAQLSADTDSGGDGIPPESGWYDDNGVDFRIISDTASDINGWRSGGVYLVKNDANQQSFTAAQDSQNFYNFSTSEGINRTLTVAKADKAGRTVQATFNVYVDTTAPMGSIAINIPPDIPGTSGVTPDAGWYDQESILVGITITSNMDIDSYRLAPYVFKNSINQTDWAQYAANTINILTTAGESVPRTIYAGVIDRAGNIRYDSKAVNIDITAPQVVLNVEFDRDSKGDGIDPEPYWFDDANGVTISWDFSESGGFNSSALRYYISPMQTTWSAWFPSSVGSAVALPVTGNPVIPNTFYFQYKDKSGFVRTASVNVYVDTAAPGPFTVRVRADADSGGDGIDPLPGWYDNTGVDIDWTQPSETGQLRDYCYQVKNSSGSTGWSNFLSSGAFAYIDLYTAPLNNSPITVSVRAVDRAGNVSSANDIVYVDTTAPAGYVTVNVQADSQPNWPYFSPQSDPDGTRWYNDTGVDISINDDVTDTSLRSFKYFAKNDAGSQVWVNFDTNSYTNLYTLDGGNTKRIITCAIADKAGNLSVGTASVYVDTVVPVINNGSLGISVNTLDNGNDGFLPETGWYDISNINVALTGTITEQNLRTSSAYAWMNYRGGYDSIRYYTDTPSKNGAATYEYSGQLYIGDQQYYRLYVLDKAGNFTYINTPVFNVDTLAVPTSGKTIDIVQDTDSKGDGIDPLQGWDDDGFVDFTWSEFTDEGGGLRTYPFYVAAKYSSTNMSVPVTWSTPINVDSRTYQNLPVAPLNATANYILIKVVDHAGNVSQIQTTINVDITTPNIIGFNNSVPISLNIWADSSDVVDDVSPDAGYYDDQTVDLDLTPTKSMYDAGGFRDQPYYIRNSDGSVDWIMQNSPTFNNIFTNAGNDIVRNFDAYIVDKAGNVNKERKGIYVDVNLPQPFYTEIRRDGDSNNDGVEPEEGWYDDESVELKWDPSFDTGGLKAKPFRFKVDAGQVTWSAWQFETATSEFFVQAGNNTTRNIMLQVADKAGNVVTYSVYIKVDKTVPAGFLLQPVVNSYTYPNIAPSVGWYNKDNLIVSWSAASDSGQLKSTPYRAKVDNNAWSDWFTNQNFQFSGLSDGLHNFYFQAADRAGNIKTNVVSLNIIAQAPDATMELSDSRIGINYPMSATINMNQLPSVTPNAYIKYPQSGGTVYPLHIYGRVGNSYIATFNFNPALTPELQVNFYLSATNNAGWVIFEKPIGNYQIARSVGTPSLTLRDQDDNDPSWTDDLSVFADIQGDEGASYWLITEIGTSPTVTDNRWSNSNPTYYSFKNMVNENKMVYLWIMDSIGNISVPSVATINLDNTPPIASIVQTPANFIAAGPVSVTLNFNEPLHPGTTPTLSYVIGTDNPVVLALTQIGTSQLQWKTNYTVTNGKNGTLVYSVQSRDRANVYGVQIQSGGVHVVDSTGPNPVTLVIADRYFQTSDYTDDGELGIAITNDGDAVAWLVTMNIATPNKYDPSWSSSRITEYNIPVSYFTQGTKTVYAWIKDAAGNVAIGAGSDTTYLDLTAPTVNLLVVGGSSEVGFGVNTVNIVLSEPLLSFSLKYLMYGQATPVTVNLVGFVPGVTTTLIGTFNVNYTDPNGQAEYQVNLVDRAYNSNTVVNNGRYFTIQTRMPAPSVSVSDMNSPVHILNNVNEAVVSLNISSPTAVKWIISNTMSTQPATSDAAWLDVPFPATIDIKNYGFTCPPAVENRTLYVWVMNQAQMINEDICSFVVQWDPVVPKVGLLNVQIKPSSGALATLLQDQWSSSGHKLTSGQAYKVIVRADNTQDYSLGGIAVSCNNAVIPMSWVGYPSNWYEGNFTVTDTGGPFYFDVVMTDKAGNTSTNNFNGIDNSFMVGSSVLEGSVSFSNPQEYKNLSGKIFVNVDNPHINIDVANARYWLPEVNLLSSSNIFTNDKWTNLKPLQVNIGYVEQLTPASITLWTMDEYGKLCNSPTIIEFYRNSQAPVLTDVGRVGVSPVLNSNWIAGYGQVQVKLGFNQKIPISAVPTVTVQYLDQSDQPQSYTLTAEYDNGTYDPVIGGSSAWNASFLVNDSWKDGQTVNFQYSVDNFGGLKGTGQYSPTYANDNRLPYKTDFTTPTAPVFTITDLDETIPGWSNANQIKLNIDSASDAYQYKIKYFYNGVDQGTTDWYGMLSNFSLSKGAGTYNIQICVNDYAQHNSDYSDPYQVVLDAYIEPLDIGSGKYIQVKDPNTGSTSKMASTSLPISYNYSHNLDIDGNIKYLVALTPQGQNLSPAIPVYDDPRWVSSNNKSTTFDISAYDNGFYRMHFWVRDQAGNRTSMIQDIEKDTAVPTSTYTLDIPGTKVAAGTLTVNILVSDPVNNYALTLNISSLAYKQTMNVWKLDDGVNGPDFSTLWRATVNISEAQNWNGKTADYIYRVTDQAGNVANSLLDLEGNKSFVIDNIPPGMNSATLLDRLTSDRNYTNSRTVTINFSGIPSDLSYFIVTENGTYVTADIKNLPWVSTINFPVTYNFLNITNEEKLIYYYGRDEAFNWSVTEAAIVYDTIKPTLSLVKNPAEYVKAGMLMVTLNISEQTSTPDLFLTCSNGATVIVNNLTRVSDYFWTGSLVVTSGLSEGLATLSVIVTDNARNTQNIFTNDNNFIIDLTPPDAQINIPYNYQKAGSFAVSFDISEAVSTPTVTVRDSAGGVIQISAPAKLTGNTWQATLNVTEALAQGTASINIGVYDYALNYASKSGVFVIDTIPPLITFRYFHEFINVGGETLTISAYTDEILSVTPDIKLNIAGQAPVTVTFNSKSGPTYNATFVIKPEFSDGVASFNLVAEDLAHNVTNNFYVIYNNDVQVGTKEIIIDKTPPPAPVFSIHDRTNGSILNTNETIISVNIEEDPGVYKWFISNAYIPSLTPHTGGWLDAMPATYIIPGIDEGTKNIYLWVMDKAGNINQIVPSHSIYMDLTLSSPVFVGLVTTPDGALVLKADDFIGHALGKYNYIISVNVVEEKRLLDKEPLLEFRYRNGNSSIYPELISTRSYVNGEYYIQQYAYQLVISDFFPLGDVDLYLHVTDNASNAIIALSQGNDSNYNNGPFPFVKIDINPGLPSLNIFDQDTGDQHYTNDLAIGVDIPYQADVRYWALGEINTSPNFIWQNNRPASYVFKNNTSGVKTLYLWIKDRYSNISSEVVTSSINYDNTVPAISGIDIANKPYIGSGNYTVTFNVSEAL
ncbi:MAG: hypothetical protein DKM50_01205, partial [Candidatus Margulisiibacteriota bacterium]